MSAGAGNGRDECRARDSYRYAVSYSMRVGRIIIRTYGRLAAE